MHRIIIVVVILVAPSNCAGQWHSFYGYLEGGEGTCEIVRVEIDLQRGTLGDSLSYLEDGIHSFDCDSSGGPSAWAKILTKRTPIRARLSGRITKSGDLSFVTDTISVNRTSWIRLRFEGKLYEGAFHGKMLSDWCPHADKGLVYKSRSPIALRRE